MRHVVRVLENEDQLTVDSEESVLMAAIRKGMQLLHDCAEGGCGTSRDACC